MSGAEVADGSPIFTEERRPSPLIVKRLCFGAVLVVALVLLLVPLSWLARGGIGGGLLLFVWLLWASRFTIRLDQEFLRLRMAPFPTRRIPLEEISGASTHMSYPWGIGKRGWSISKSPGVTVYFTNAGAGVVLELVDGRAVWLNSDQPEKLVSLLPKRRKRR
jgi:hypothetical protein